MPRRLVGLLVFKTSAPVTSWWVGSIPMHFRHMSYATSYVTGISGIEPACSYWGLSAPFSGKATGASPLEG